MTTTNGISNAQSPFNPTSTTSDLAQGSLGKEDFLKLLVAQLSHQDPTAPTDPGEFVAQLSQFSSLEQLANIKSGMDLLAITQTAGTSAQMVSFIGKDVSYDGGQINWSADSKPVELKMTLGGNAASVEQRIVDERGTVIEKRDLGPMTEGSHTLNFDGKKADGTPLPPGTYNIELTAKDANGKTTDATLRGEGLVSAVTFEAGYPQLVLADGRVLGLGQVLQVLGADDPVPAVVPPGLDPNDRVMDPDPTHTDDANVFP